MMKRFFFALLAAAAVAAPAAVSAASRDGVTRVAYGAAAPTIVCTPLFVCDLTLQPGETILNLAIGDSVRWVVSPAQSGSGADGTPHVLIKPTESNLATNLLVTTTKRTYAVDLRSAKSGAMERVGFTYPVEAPPAPAATPTPAPTAAAPVAAPTDPPVPQIDYAYQTVGTNWLSPTQVSNDGTRTYIRYASPPPRLPALLALGPNGYELVNYRVTDGRLFIVDGLPARFVLVSGSGKAQINVTVSHR